MEEKRAVSPVISVILMVAIAVILAATIATFVLGFAEDVHNPAPSVGQTSGEFVAGGDRDQQVVRITHVAGDSVAVENIEIIVRASGPGVDTEARLVDLPSTASSKLLNENIDGNDDLIDQRSGSTKLIADDGTDVWSAGETIEFRVNSGTADFRDGETPAANELEVDIVYVDSESSATLFEETFRP
ncbi:type IV pilin N-terminal domain-containing protein (plasmid) [Haloarcula marismortui ATCC 33800]|uniref:Type IV pilin N-terminal domain-containing protein n=2 Tax=Haloarcula marismortui ATCC 33800 TaxID=662476 RepID=A0A8T8KLH1_9EURY|nr:type IV pilin N-terminal domain-containing protein [Haloarcula sinaiiensis]QUJ74734.1 type IV pilin N-terminal domain-containing protein [Haloarcula sinaiiensis ATCC 33800]